MTDDMNFYQSFLKDLTGSEIDELVFDTKMKELGMNLHKDL